jgi:hypothetical protein
MVQIFKEQNIVSDDILSVRVEGRGNDGWARAFYSSVIIRCISELFLINRFDMMSELIGFQLRARIENIV